MGSDYSYCTKLERLAWKGMAIIFPLTVQNWLQNTEKTFAHAQGFSKFKLHHPDCMKANNPKYQMFSQAAQAKYIEDKVPAKHIEDLCWGESLWWALQVFFFEFELLLSKSLRFLLVFSLFIEHWPFFPWKVVKKDGRKVQEPASIAGIQRS